MGIIDNFIYRVKTGRLFAGFDKQDESVNRRIKSLEAKLKALEETNTESTINKLQAETPEEIDENSIETPPAIKPKEKTVDVQTSVKKQIGPDLIIHFILNHKTYIVEKFNLHFQQDVDSFKNRPNSFTYGGTMQITLSGFLDSALDEWITQTYQMRDGEIHFFPNMPKITDSSLLTIFFTDAYCTNCKKTVDVTTSGILTTLTVTPRKIKIGKEEFENSWKEKEKLAFTIKSV